MIPGFKLTAGAGLHNGKLYLGSGSPRGLVIDPNCCFTPCRGGCIPTGLYVQFAGFANSGCNNCGNLNTSFWVPHDSNQLNCSGWFAGPDCFGPGTKYGHYHVAVFKEDFTSVPICLGYLIVRIRIYWFREVGWPEPQRPLPTDTRIIVVDLFKDGDGELYFARFAKCVEGGPYRCLEFNGYDVPYSDSWKAYCNNTSAACSVSSP